MNTLKKNISFFVLFLSAICIFCMMPQKVSASDYSDIVIKGDNKTYYAVDENNLMWMYQKCPDGTIALNGTYKDVVNDNGSTGKSACKLGETVKIPKMLDGLTVSRVYKLTGYEGRVSDLTKSCGADVKNVIMPDGIKAIGSGAFTDCIKLDNINIPDSVCIASSSSFNKAYLDKHRDNDGLVIISGILFDGHRASGDITIPDTVRCIADDAFMKPHCGPYLYEDYNGINSVTIPSSVKRIGAYAFENSNVSKVTFSEGNEVIGNCAFNECPNLKDINLPQSINDISEDSFDWNNINTKNENGFIVSNGLLISGRKAKGNIVIPNDITRIIGGAFRNNNDITSVTIPANVKDIPSYAFCNCTSLNNVTIENGILSIGEDAFENTAIKSIAVPQTVTKIGDAAFVGCSMLNDVSYGQNTSVGVNSFSYTPWIQKIKGSSNFSIYNGVLLKYYSDGKNEVSVPDGVKKIAPGAFWNGRNNECINKIKLPEGVKNIGKFAFSECRNLNEIYMPSTVQSIDKSAFCLTDNIKFTGEKADYAQSIKGNN